MKSITVDNVTYNFDPMANDGLGGITTSGAGIPSFTYDGTTKTLTVDTDTANATGGEFSAVMTTGAFTFQPTSGFTSERVSYVLADRDGDTASNTVTLSAGVGADINAAMLGEFESGNSLPDNTILGTFTATGDLNSNGNDVIAGQNNTTIFVNGGDNDDELYGGSGSDTLTGGDGNDNFRLFSPTEGVDTIFDFSKVGGNTDKIYLDDAGFTAIGPSLDDAEFLSGAGVTTATTSTQRIIYDASSGALYYDADGSSAGAAVQILNLGVKTHPNLTASDFQIF